MSETITLNGRYQLNQKVGQGAYAAVYQATDLRLKRTVAVKQLHSHLVQQQGELIQRQFMQEAQVMANLDHPHFVRVFDFGEDGYKLYLVMEWMPQGDLAQQVAAGQKFTPAEVYTLLNPIAEALDVAHAQGLVHRDLKPHNILFDAHQRPKLGDFGLVKVLDGTLFASNPAYSNGQLLGTPAYMAPEQAQGKAVTAQTDVYALAVLAFHLLMGEPPFQGDSAMAVMFSGLTTPREELAERMEGVPAGVRAGVLQGLAVEMGKRPGKATELMALLRPEVKNADILSVTPPINISSSTKEIETTPPVADVPIQVGKAKPSLRSELVPGVWLEWVEIPAGPFWMGAHPEDTKALLKERPYHQVTVEGFRLGKYPVTNAQFEAFIKATNHKSVDEQQQERMDKAKQDYPVRWVSWSDAVAFCEWASQKTGEKIYLPTETEWEKGARGTDGRIYPWGMKWEEGRSNSWSTGPKTTVIVTQHPGGVSPYGVWDMVGNVWEWTNSWYMAYPGNTYRDSDYGRKYRVVRGGSWNDSREFLRLSYRIRNEVWYRDSHIGFRCASTLY